MVVKKIDIGTVMTRVNEKDMNRLREVLRQYNIIEEPTHCFDIYKCRRGRYKGIRIWSRIDLATGKRKDLFATTQENKPFLIPDIFESSLELEINDWSD